MATKTSTLHYSTTTGEGSIDYVGDYSRSIIMVDDTPSHYGCVHSIGYCAEGWDED